MANSGPASSPNSQFMPNQFILEVCAESVNHAVAAERGGADRLELCSDLPSGGVTPRVDLMQAARRRMNIPIHVLIRPRAGDFCYSDHEFEIMRGEIQAAKRFGMNGIVLGILNADHRVDIERTKSLVEAARPLPVTFHRAFDASQNLKTALEDVIQTGASRILTSGGQPTAIQGVSALAGLAQTAKDRILIMACGAINADNIADIARTTQTREFHTSVGTSHPRSESTSNRQSYGNDAIDSSLPAGEFEERVRSLVNILGNLADSSPLKARPDAAAPPQNKEPTT
jgi:copper homeostasis protein